MSKMEIRPDRFRTDFQSRRMIPGGEMTGYGAFEAAAAQDMKKSRAQPF
jgi:hypothetical protein